MLDYTVYGALVRSEFPLPELPPAASVRREPDVNIGTGEASLGEPLRAPFDGHLPDGRLWLRTTPYRDAYLVEFPQFADFVVKPGAREIRKRSTRAGVQDATVRHLLIDTVLPLFFNSVGRDMIHATAVTTNAGVCAFTGPAGTGKSTIAAAMVKAGAALMCDDCLALDLSDGCLALPGYQGLRLWPDSAAAVGAQSQTSIAVAEYSSKARMVRGILGRLCDEAKPLRRIYRVYRTAESRGAPRVESLEGAQRLMVLVEGAYRLDLGDSAMLARQFRYLSMLSERVPVKALYLPDDLSALPAACEVVLRDLADDARVDGSPHQ
jgi:hypothetical protein